MFRNIEQCANNKTEMDKSYDQMDYTDARVGECVFPIYYLEVCDVDYWEDGDKKFAEQELKLRLENCKPHCSSWICYRPTCTTSKCTA